jgi:hypothetical protein
MRPFPENSNDLELLAGESIALSAAEFGTPGRKINGSGRWMTEEHRRENFRASGQRMVQFGMDGRQDPIATQDALWASIGISRADGEGMLEDNVAILERAIVRATVFCMKLKYIPHRSHLYTSIGHAPIGRQARVPGRVRLIDRLTRRPADGWVKVNVFLGGGDGPPEVAHKAFAHRVRSTPLARSDEHERLAATARSYWRRILARDRGYTQQAIELAAAVQDDLLAVGAVPTDHAVVLCKAALEGHTGDVGLADGPQELPGDNLRQVVRAARAKLLPGSLILAAASGPVDDPFRMASPDWAVRTNGASVPAAEAIRALTLREPGTARRVITLAQGESWDISGLKGEVLLNGMPCKWSLVVFRAFAENPDGTEGVEAVAYPYLCSVDLSDEDSGPPPDIAQMIAEALVPLHAPTELSAMFHRCRAFSFRRPLDLLSINGRNETSQALFESLRDFMNLGRVVACFAEEHGGELLEVRG